MSPPIDCLTDDALERIFSLLDFRSLLHSEMTCRRWRRVIAERRLFRTLSRTLLARPPPFPGFAHPEKKKKEKAERIRLEPIRTTRPIKLWGHRGRRRRRTR